MGRRGSVFTFAVAAVALFASPVAHADDHDFDFLYDPGVIYGPIGNPTNVQNFYIPLLGGYSQSDDLYHVLDNGNLIGQFLDTRTGMGLGSSPPILFIPSYSYYQDAISDSTWADLPDGSLQSHATWSVWLLTSPYVFYQNDYLSIPGVRTEDLLDNWILGLENHYLSDGTGTSDVFIWGGPSVFQNEYLSDATGTSDILTLFGQSFTLFDIPPATAAMGADAVEPSWLTDFAAWLDPANLF